MSTFRVTNPDKLLKAYIALKDAFIWHFHPKGHSYWQYIFEDIQKIGGFAHYPGISKILQSADIELCKEFCENLASSFAWDNSPQGAMYWSEAYNAVKAIVEASGETLDEDDGVQKPDPIKAYDRAMKGV